MHGLCIQGSYLCNLHQYAVHQYLHQYAVHQCGSSDPEGSHCITGIYGFTPVRTVNVAATSVKLAMPPPMINARPLPSRLEVAQSNTVRAYASVSAVLGAPLYSP